MSEHEEQSRFSTWLTVKGIKHTAIPNSFFTGQKNWGLIQKFKAEGWHKGFPDLLLIVPHRKKKVTVFIEMKDPKHKPKRGGKGGVSDDQREWIDALDECEMTGAYVAYGNEHAQKIVSNLMDQ